MRKRAVHSIKRLLQAAGAIIGAYLCIRYASECARGILNGILFCIEVLVPSLFVFMVLAAYIIQSGLTEPLTKPFDRLTKKLFGLPYPALAVLLLAVIGGYPVGARCASMLYEQRRLSAGQARKTVYIAVCAGPGFLLNYIGRALLGSPDAGFVLLIAATAGVLITGTLIGKAIQTPDRDQPPGAAVRMNGSLLTASVYDASKSTFSMCAMVVLCCALIEVTGSVCGQTVFTDILSAVTEITTGCSMLCGRYPLYIIAFFVGFGGISVHLQIFSALGELGINKGLFILFRLVQGIITAALTYILLMVFPIEISVFNSTDAELTAARSATLFGSAALIVCALCFLGSVTKMKQRR